MLFSVGMFPFYTMMAIFAVVALFDIFDIPLNQRSKKILYCLLIVILILYAGLRQYDWPPGVDVFDYGTYEYTYLNPVDPWNFWEEFSDVGGGMGSLDPGYVFVSSFFSKYIFSSPNLFFLLISFVSVVLLVKSFKRNDIHTALLLILFVFLQRLYFQYNFIMMRQGLAMAIVWWGIPFIRERKFWRFLLICLTGTVFHFSALFFLIAYFLPLVRFSNRFIFITAPILFIMGITGVTKGLILGALELGMGLMDMSRAIFYLTSDTWNLGINMLNFVEIAPFMFVAIKYRKEITADANGRLFFNMLVFYLLFLLVIMNFMGLVRLSSYFIYSYFFIISFTFSKLHIVRNKTVIGMVMIGYFLVYGIRLCLNYFPDIGYNIFFLK